MRRLRAKKYRLQPCSLYLCKTVLNFRMHNSTSLVKCFTEVVGKRVRIMMFKVRFRKFSKELPI